MIKRCMVSLVICFSVSFVHAQVEFNGSMDIGISSGGESSAFIYNGIEHEFRYMHFSIPQINLLLFAPINDNFYVEGRLQSDSWGTGTLRPPRFTLANITYANPESKHRISAGRFITPLGFYPSRNLTIDRTFIDFPLNYSYYHNISDIYGYWPESAYENDYNYNGGLMTNIYFGGYATGLRWDWSIQEEKLELLTALTSVSPGSARNYTNLANAALMTRLIYNPAIEWQLGFSASYGSFMHHNYEANGIFRQFSPLEQYRQTLAGVDVKYGMGYWEVIGEAVFTNWKVPLYYDYDFVFTDGEANQYYLSSVGANLDVRFEPPFFTGSYFGLRFDHLNFLDENPTSEANNYSSEDWDKDVLRISTALGYKLARNVEAKVQFSEQSPFDLSLYTFKAMITAFF